VTKTVALIPARGGSKRILGKNTKVLARKPLIYYTINSALNANIFDQILVSTDDQVTADLSQEFGAIVPGLRPPEFSTDNSPDIEWVTHAVHEWLGEGVSTLAILRPTSPLRKPSTIREAFSLFTASDWADSLRGMQPISEHPGKMWRINSDNEASPYLDQLNRDVPTHSSPTNTLEKLWVQNASLEFVRVSTILDKKSLAGDRILKFELPGFEGYDLNTINDWKYLEFLIEQNPSLLPINGKE